MASLNRADECLSVHVIQGGPNLALERTPQRKSRKGCSVVESYCGACGVFIAASSGPNLLELAERLHRCPGAPGDEKAGQFSSEEARIVSYLFGVGQTPDQGKVDDELGSLLNELTAREPLLNQWLERSAMNARWFRKDPIAALRAANIGFNESMLKELESFTTSIAERLRSGFIA
jgi:hypothetical protein